MPLHGYTYRCTAMEAFWMQFSYWQALTDCSYGARSSVHPGTERRQGQDCSVSIRDQLTFAERLDDLIDLLKSSTCSFPTTSLSSLYLLLWVLCSCPKRLFTFSHVMWYSPLLTLCFIMCLDWNMYFARTGILVFSVSTSWESLQTSGVWRIANLNKQAQYPSSLTQYRGNPCPTIQTPIPYCTL